MTIVTTIRNLAHPFCSACQKRSLPHKHCSLCNGNVLLNYLKALKLNHQERNIQEADILQASVVCSNCYMARSYGCSLCNEKTTINYSDSLKRNHLEHNVREPDALEASFICKACFTARSYVRCSLTGSPFHLEEDISNSWNNSGRPELMAPYHNYGKHFEKLSPEGLPLLNNAYATYEENLESFIGGTRGEYIRGYDIDRTLRRIEVKEVARCKNSGEVEDCLKRYCAQIGANGYIKFFWDKKLEHHEQTYVAGYGNKGNPYYRTKRWTTSYFVGHAEAVFLKSRSL
jgi:hypothetical protein